MVITRDIPPLSTRAAFAPRTINESARTVALTWSTGAKVLRGFFDPFYEELSLDPKHVRLGRLNGGAPLLEAHQGADLSSVLGVVVEGTARVNGTEGTATVRFARSEDDRRADEIFRKVKDGIITNVSVGYRVLKFEKTDDAKIPTYRAIDWEPFELSLVPIGADAGAGVRSEFAYRAGLERNDCLFIPADGGGLVNGITDAERNLRLARATSSSGARLTWRPLR
jgi:HK97 family phage prohead protease